MLEYRVLISVVNLFILTLVPETCQLNESSLSRDYITSMTDKLELLSQNEKLHLNLMDYVDQLQKRIDVIKR